MTAAVCVNCKSPIVYRYFPLCPVCRLFVVDEAELELAKGAPIKKLYRDDDDGTGNESN